MRPLYNRTMLHNAILFNCLPVANLLLQDQELDLTIVDYYGHTALSLAAQMGRADILEHILCTKRLNIKELLEDVHIPIIYDVNE